MDCYGLTKLFWGETWIQVSEKNTESEFIALGYTQHGGPGKLIGRGPSPHAIHGSIIENPCWVNPSGILRCGAKE